MSYDSYIPVNCLRVGIDSGGSFLANCKQFSSDLVGVVSLLNNLITVGPITLMSFIDCSLSQSSNPATLSVLIAGEGLISAALQSDLNRGWPE